MKGEKETVWMEEEGKVWMDDGLCVCALSLDRKLNIRKHVHLQPPQKNNPTDMGAKQNASITFSPYSIFYMPNVSNFNQWSSIKLIALHE